MTGKTFGLVVDETEPIGREDGPNHTRFLPAAAGYCNSSSLVHCLHKSRIETEDFETIVKTDVARNEEGRLRVKSLDVNLQLEVNEEDRMRVPRSLKILRLLHSNSKYKKRSLRKK